MKHTIIGLLVAAALSPIGARALPIWVKVEEPKEFNKDRYELVIDVHGAVSRDGKIYFNQGLMDARSGEVEAIQGAIIDCRARINPLGFYIPNREEIESRPRESHASLLAQNKILEIFCPPEWLSKDFDEAKPHM